MSKDDIVQAHGSIFSSDEWITIEDVTKDGPTETDEEVIDELNLYSHRNYYLAGQVLIQHFVVILKRESKCLCLGIRTYVSVVSCYVYIDSTLSIRPIRLVGLGVMNQQKYARLNFGSIRLSLALPLLTLYLVLLSVA